MGVSNAKNLNYLRNCNQGEIIKNMLLCGPISRLDLADKLGLTKMSISYIVNDLIDKGIAIETEIDCNKAFIAGQKQRLPGRRPTFVSLVPDSLFAIGVYISRDKVTSSISNICGQTKESLEDTIPPQTTAESLFEMINKHIERLSRHPVNIIGIGIACIGLIDTIHGIIAQTTDFFNIRDFPINDMLSQHFDLPVFLVNDMKAAAIAEHLYGTAKEYNNFVYVGVTNGLGAGMIVNGELFQGSNGFSCELGHMSIHKNGKTCMCGNKGCAELYISVPKILEQAGLDKWEDFLQAVENGDKSCRRLINRMSVDLGTVLVNIANIFDPQAIIIGHEGALLKEDYFEKLRRRLNEISMTRALKRISVLPSTISQSIAFLGASSVVFSKLFQGDIQGY